MEGGEEIFSTWLKKLIWKPIDYKYYVVSNIAQFDVIDRLLAHKI